VTLKSYYGSNIREALNVARRELGPDAVVVASRQVDISEALPGEYEVVCGLLPADKPSGLKTAVVQKSKPPAQAQRIPADAARAHIETPWAPELQPQSSSGLAQLKKRVKTIRTAISAPADAEPEVSEMRLTLMLDGFGESLTSEILSGVRQRLRESGKQNGPSALSAEAALTAELNARLPTEASLGRPQARRRITALVGPPGIGKTSLIVKLAVRYGLTGRRPMRLISMDGSRVGGADALRTYAAGMAVPIDVLETGASLSQALDAHAEAGLILIDTPGFAPADLPEATELAQALSRNTEVDVQLVLSATMSPADLKSTFTRFRVFLPTRIALTQTDNAVSCRSAIGLCLANDMAMSFAGTGQRIPEDLEEATVASLLRAPGRPAGRNAVSAA